MIAPVLASVLTECPCGRPVVSASAGRYEADGVFGTYVTHDRWSCHVVNGVVIEDMVKLHSGEWRHTCDVPRATLEGLKP